MERLWQVVKYEELYLEACISGLKVRRELEVYFWFYGDLGPGQALSYRIRVLMFRGDWGVGGESKGRRYSDGSV